MMMVSPPLIPINSVIVVGTSDEPPDNMQALARMLVMRRMRVPVVPGASIGTPCQLIWLAPPLAMP